MWRCVLLILPVLGCDSNKFRLAETVKPLFYEITVLPNLDNESFTGETTIHLKVERLITSFQLHSHVVIDKVFFDNEIVHNECSCSNGFGLRYKDFEKLEIFTKNRSAIAEGAHFLRILFSGEFSKNESKGIFKGSYLKNYTTEYLLATDFETMGARKVFPCFDEPKFKAPFQLNLLVPNSSYVALANMRSKATFTTKDGILYKFEPTPIMSTYLLSFAITKCDFSEFVDIKNIPYRLYSANPNNVSDIKLLNFSSKVINFYSDYTNFSFNLPKIDFIGFDRYKSSATENWGLVTFNTSLISASDNLYSDDQKQTVIAHELAHFWFGNLVTNDWWNDLWLQESLASFMSLKAEEAILQNQSNNFPTMYHQSLFWSEKRSTTNAVITFYEEPQQVERIFSDITYYKGAALLQMAEEILDENHFKSAIREYIQKFAFKSATTSDFISTLEKFTNEVNFRDFLQTYLYQSGFPVVFVDANDDAFILTQETWKNSSFGVFDHKWTIPIYISTNTYNSTLIWFDRHLDKLLISKNYSHWILLNQARTGYYRVSYSEALWKLFIEHYQTISLSDRNYIIVEAIDLLENVDLCDNVFKFMWKSSKNGLNLSTIQTSFVLVKELALDKGQLKIFFSCILYHTNNIHLAEKLKKPYTTMDFQDLCKYERFCDNYLERGTEISVEKLK